VSDIAAIMTAFAGLLVPLGGGAAFVWRHIERRFKDIYEKLAKCEERDRSHQERRSIMTAVVELLWSALASASPDSPALKRAEKLMTDLKNLTDGQVR